MKKHEVKTLLVKLLAEKDCSSKVVEHLKTLSPSGVELEIMTLANFDVEKESELQTPEQKIRAFVDQLLAKIKKQ